MSGVNKVILVGRLGKDPEVKSTQDGSKVCSFPMATSETWTDKTGQKQEKTEWHNINAWGKVGENCSKYLSKGRQVYIEGKLQTHSWDDKETGKKRYATSILANTVQFLGSANDSQSQGQSQQSAPFAQSGQNQSNQVNDFSSGFSDNDIPF